MQIVPCHVIFTNIMYLYAQKFDGLILHATNIRNIIKYIRQKWLLNRISVNNTYISSLACRWFSPKSLHREIVLRRILNKIKSTHPRSSAILFYDPRSTFLFYLYSRSLSPMLALSDPLPCGFSSLFLFPFYTSLFLFISTVLLWLFVSILRSLSPRLSPGNLAR